MRKFILLALVSVSTSAFAQVHDSLEVIKLNRQIDDYVVSRNVAALTPLYADDFVFSHGTGLVEGKKSWLAAVARNTYPLRQHDSMKVELHKDLAILRGKMNIQRVDKTKTAKYMLDYIRVYGRQAGGWVLVSHITTKEVHEN